MSRKGNIPVLILIGLAILFITLVVPIPVIVSQEIYCPCLLTETPIACHCPQKRKIQWQQSLIIQLWNVLARPNPPQMKSILTWSQTAKQKFKLAVKIKDPELLDKIQIYSGRMNGTIMYQGKLVDSDLVVERIVSNVSEFTFNLDPGDYFLYPILQPNVPSGHGGFVALETEFHLDKNLEIETRVLPMF